MAKIFKVSGYFVDTNDVVDKEKFEGKLESLEDLFSQHLHIEEFDIGEWDEESPLNYDNCDLADCEKYFKRKVPVDNDRNVTAGQVYRHFNGHIVKVLHISQDTETPGSFMWFINAKMELFGADLTECL